MEEKPPTNPSFNLWNEPWITVESRSGPLQQVSIAQALQNAQDYHAIYDHSPLVVVGIYRLLTAILQAAISPQTPQEILHLWHSGHFPKEKITAFREQYAHRFDLFSEQKPFYQSADLPMEPAKGDNIKTVAYLFPDTPSSTNITHYKHTYDGDQVYCPACAVKGLVVVPCFATTGGRTIKPSINGVPPIYVLPGGDSLFECLAGSLILPEYQPGSSSNRHDLAWWVHPPIVLHSSEVFNVGYLHSLTFPARRVRLHPTETGRACSRCGQISSWTVASMVFDMGETRTKEAAFWFDPFAAYRLPSSKSEKNPTPIRPVEGKALWREYAGLFLPQSEKDPEHTKRPAVLYQLANENVAPERLYIPVRCVGIRTDMKAKVFEWIDASFELPSTLLADEDAAYRIRQSIQFAQECALEMKRVFGNYFGGKSKKSERYRDLKQRMETNYWSVLAEPFKLFILHIASPESTQTWADAVQQAARSSFAQAIAATGDDAASLRRQVEGQRQCNIKLAVTRKKYFPEGANE